ncbi:SHS family sialic acid transporter-like MFS transporter [Tamaricihabitans halophyticus]|uniref:SHS family sialic acid transporter-like MFS transporter n=1 Tax=Tamaricihabitans halophyticus TaxID=1262583 RepID=A0A4R2QCP6_9PSEU|nr:sialate:H+ symport family MFS transporter [Tamaricihabitans halophyticus]TCP46803.1 SHS family sialic acid transporter-like MFS transporter [Tamaricihabitans halophyticus]
MAASLPQQPTSFWRLSRGQRKAFLAAWLGYLLDGFDFILITLVLTEIAEEFDLGLTQAATLISAAFASRWLGGLILGAIGDRYGRKPAMILSILAFSVGSALCGFAWGYWSLFIFRAIVGIGMAGEYGSSATYVMESWPTSMRNRATGFLLSAYPIGTVVAALAYEVIVPSLGWRWLFYVGLVPIALTLYLRRALPEAEEWVRDVGARKEVTTSSALFSAKRRWPNVALSVVLAGGLGLIFSDNAGGFGIALVIIAIIAFCLFAVQLSGKLWPVMFAIMVTVFCAFLYSWPIQSLLPTYLKTELGFDEGSVSTALTWAGLGYAAGCCLAGILGDRLGTRRAYVLGLVVSLAFVFPVFALSSDNILLLWILLFAMQLTSQGISGLLPKYIGDHFPTRLRAAGLGFSYNVGALGGAVAPLLGAAVGEQIGLGNALTLLASTLTITVALIIGLNLPARLGRALRVPSDAPALNHEPAANKQS